MEPLTVTHRATHRKLDLPRDCADCLQRTEAGWSPCSDAHSFTGGFRARYVREWTENEGIRRYERLQQRISELGFFSNLLISDQAIFESAGLGFDPEGRTPKRPGQDVSVRIIR
jgi:hypothetical protein